MSKVPKGQSIPIMNPSVRDKGRDKRIGKKERMQRKECGASETRGEAGRKEGRGGEGGRRGKGESERCEG